MSTQQSGQHSGQQFRATERIEAPQGGPGPRHSPMGGMVGQKAMSFGPSARRMVARMAPERAATLVVLALTLASVAAMASGPRLLGHATDLVFRGFLGDYFADTPADRLPGTARAQGVVPGVGIDFDAVGRTLVLTLLVYVAASAASWAAGYVLNGVVQRTVAQLRREVEDKIHRLPLAYFDRSPRGELLSRVTNDIDNVGQTLQQTMSQLLNALLTVVAVLAMMVWISPVLALIALVSVPVSLLATKAIMGRSQGQFVAQWRRTGQLNGHIEESYSGHALVKVFGRQEEFDRAFAEHNDGLFEVSFRAQFLSGLIMPTMMFIGNISYVLVAVVGGLRVASGTLSVGEVQAFIQYTRQFNQPLTTVASMANLLQSGVASVERVFELLDADEERDPTGAGEATAPLRAAAGVRAGEVAFEHVDFSYDPDRPLISDLSLVARPGQTVAIVGPTGAGKTTLVNLVMRFYELDRGRITLDGVDIATLGRRELRRRTGMVLQDAWLFEGTIRDNLAYGRPEASEEEILQAARATFVDRFVRSLPEGYDTVLDEEGSNLSAGERQLLTIARAFLTDPDLLILDEATSSVDTRTEVLVQQAMAALRADRTSFVIAHRLSTIRDADLILVMDAGAIVEQGTHTELLAAGGAYAALYRSQFAG